MKKVIFFAMLTSSVLGWHFAAGGRKVKENTARSFKYGRPVRCMLNEKGRPIRAQCSRTTKVCLYNRHPEGLNLRKRVRSGLATRLRLPGRYYLSEELFIRCRNYRLSSWKGQYKRYKKMGYEFVRADWEVPRGYVRDAQGRLMQVDFDLLRRFHLGFGYAPRVRPKGNSDGGRIKLDLGWTVALLDRRSRGLHTFEFLMGRFYLNPFSFAGTLFDYDYMRRSDKPLFKITTFWGGPKRHDIYVNLGFGFGLGRLTTLENDPLYNYDVEIGVLRLNWDLWHSMNMYHFFRLQFGSRIGLLTGSDIHNVYVNPFGALRFQLVPDSLGHHLIRARLEAGSIYLSREKTWKTKALIGVGYEYVLIAINDQPISWYAEASASYSDRLVRGSAWDIRFDTGLRINFWSPVRPRLAPVRRWSIGNELERLKQDGRYR